MLSKVATRGGDQRLSRGGSAHGGAPSHSQPAGGAPSQAPPAGGATAGLPRADGVLAPTLAAAMTPGAARELGARAAVRAGQRTERLHNERSRRLSRSRFAAEKQLHLEAPPGACARVPFVHPKATWKVSWDVLVAALIMFSIVSTPFRMGFSVETSNGWLICDLLVDAAFLLDILLTFRTMLYDSLNRLVRSPAVIARAYLRGFFIIDVLTTMPWEGIARLAAAGADTSSLSASAQLLRALRVLRIFRIFRVAKLGKIMESFFEVPAANECLCVHTFAGLCL